MKTKRFFIWVSLIALFSLTSFFIAYQASAQTIKGAANVIEQKKPANPSEISGLEYEMLIFEKRADLLLNKVDDLLKEIEELRSKNNEYARLLALKDNDVDKVRKELNQEVETAKKELAQELAANKTLKETIAAQSGEIKNLKDQSAAETKNSKEQLAAKEKEIASLSSDVSVKERQAASDLAAKEKLLAEKTNALSSLESAHNTIKNENIKNKDELTAIKKKLDMREEELRILKNQLSKQKDTLTAELAEKDKLIKGKDSQLGDLDRQGKQYKREIASYLSTIEQLKGKLQADQQHMADMQKKFVAKEKPAELYRQKEESKTRQVSSEMAALQEQLSLQRATIETLEKQLAAKEQPGDNAAADTGGEVPGGGAIQLEKELEIKDAELKEANAKLASRDDELFALQKKLLSIQQELAGLKADQGSKVSNVSKKDEQITKLNSQLNAVQERFEKAVLDYQRKIERLEGELVNAKKAISQQPQEPSASPRGEPVASKGTAKGEFSEKDKELNFLHTRLQEARLAQQEQNIEFKKQKEDYEKRLTELQKQLETKQQLSGPSQQLPANVTAEAASGTEQDKELARVYDTLKKAFQDEIAHQRMRLTLAKDNLVVSLLTDSLFDSGSDEIRLSSIPILSTIGKLLNNEAQEFQIVVEGNTDNQPIRYSQWKSNWELSSARALSVLHYFINECGISSSRLSMCGFGEFKPVASNDTEAGRQSNRRVEIILEPQAGAVSASNIQ